MKIRTKHFIWGGLATFAGLLIWSGKKGLETFNVANKLEVSLRGISSFPEFFGSIVRSTINIVVKNPTNTPLDVQTAGLVTLKQIRIYNRDGVLTATANPNIEGLTIGPLGEVEFKDIPIESNIKGLINTILIGSTNLNDYRIESDIEAVGQIFTI